MPDIFIDKDPANQQACCNQLYFCSAARVGFRHLLHLLEFKKHEKILLPAYIGQSINEGSGILDPIQTCQVEYDFYALNKDLSADLQDLNEKLSKPEVKVLLVIHYFGILQSDIEEIVRLCHKHNVLLVEDCAHTLDSRLKDRQLGEFGDFSLYSIHKILPVPDGGILRVNNHAMQLPSLAPQDRISLETLSVFAAARMAEISSRRRMNYFLLSKELEHADGMQIMFPELRDGDVPQNFPLLLTNQDRRQIFSELMNAGIRPVALYYQLIDPIDQQRFPLSHEISARILNLPIHQDIHEEQITFMAKTLRGLLRS